MSDLVHMPPVDPPHDATAATPGGGGGTSQSLFNGGNDNGVPVAGEADVRQHVETLVNLIRQARHPRCLA